MDIYVELLDGELINIEFDSYIPYDQMDFEIRKKLGSPYNINKIFDLEEAGDHWKIKPNEAFYNLTTIYNKVKKSHSFNCVFKNADSIVHIYKNLNIEFYGLTPLSISVIINDAELVELFLKLGANPNPNLSGTKNIVDTSVRKGNVIITEKLMAYGAKFEYALKEAVFQNNITIVLILLRNGIPEEIYKLRSYSCPLYNAIQYNNIYLVKVLLEHGFDPNKVSYNIIYSTKANHKYEILALLKKYII